MIELFDNALRNVVNGTEAPEAETRAERGRTER